MTADWKPSKELKDFCDLETPDLILEFETKEFIDYWIAVPGKGGLKLDWQATFRNHLRRHQRFAEGRKLSPLSELERLKRKDEAEEAAERASENGHEEHHPLFDDDELL